MKNEILKQGTLLIKKTGRDELYWVVTFFASYLAWHGGFRIFSNERAAAYTLLVVVLAMIVAKFTVLREMNVDHVEWSMTKKNLYLDGKEIPLDGIDQVFFRRNKLTSNSWFLDAKGIYRIHLESLSYPAAKKAESIETMKELAFALDPTLPGKPRLLPDETA